MSKHRVISVKIPPYGVTDVDALTRELKSQRIATQKIRPTELTWVKQGIDFERLEKAEQYTPKFSGHFGPCSIPPPLSSEFFLRKAMLIVQTIEDRKCKIKNAPSDSAAIDNLMTACIHLGRTLEANDLRKENLQLVTARVKQKKSLIDHNKSGTAKNKLRKAEAELWHKIAQDFILKQPDNFQKRKRSEQARSIQNELKRNKIQKATSTIENYLRDSQ